MTEMLNPPMAAAVQPGKYLAFILGRESYGVPILKVREIIRLCEITPVPQMPDYIKGVINLRGKILPVADLRLKFRMAHAENTQLTCIIVVQVTLSDHTPMLMGLIVDTVEEVINLTPENLEPTPDFGGAVDADYILGMAKLKGGVKTLLDLDRIVTSVDAGSPSEPSLAQ